MWRSDGPKGPTPVRERVNIVQGHIARGPRFFTVVSIVSNYPLLRTTHVNDWCFLNLFMSIFGLSFIIFLWTNKLAKLYNIPVFPQYTETAIPFIYSFSGISAASAPISTFMCLCAIYIFPGSVYIFPPAEQAYPSWEYIIRTQTHECGNWDWGPDIPLLGIKFSAFCLCSVQYLWKNEELRLSVYLSEAKA